MSSTVTEHDGGYDTVIETPRAHGAVSRGVVMRHLESRDDITVLNRRWLTSMLVVEIPAKTESPDALAKSRVSTT